MNILRRLRNQHGFSLAEVLVAIVIGSVLGIAIMKIFSTNSRLFIGEKTSSRTVTNARLVMDELTRSVRMLGYNPQEVTGGLFWLQWTDAACTGATPLTFTVTTITSNTALFFTRDWSENGGTGPNNNGYERVGYCFDSTSNTLKLATIDAANGKINGWLKKWPNVTAFTVDYIYSDGSNSSTVGLPNPSSSTYSYKTVEGIVLSLSVRSEKPHEMTGQYVTETVTSTVLLRNRYY